MKTVTFLGLPVFVPSLPLAFITLSPKDRCRIVFETDETEKTDQNNLSASVFCELELSSDSFCVFQKACCCVVPCLGWLRVEVCERAVRDKSGRHSVIINAVRNWLGFYS